MLQTKRVNQKQEKEGGKRCDIVIQAQPWANLQVGQSPLQIELTRSLANGSCR